MQFSLFPWLHEVFGPFPPAPGKAGMGGRENTDRRGRRKLHDPASSLPLLYIGNAVKNFTGAGQRSAIAPCKSPLPPFVKILLA